MSTEQPTPRLLIRELMSATERQDAPAIQAIRDHLKQRDAQGEEAALVPQQDLPQPLVFELWEEEHECVGTRSLSQIRDLLHEGVSLSLVVMTTLEYAIEWQKGAFRFEVWHEEGTICASTQAYGGLEQLVLAEAWRPGFDLPTFVMIS